MEVSREAGDESGEVGENKIMPGLNSELGSFVNGQRWKGNTSVAVTVQH